MTHTEPVVAVLVHILNTHGSNRNSTSLSIWYHTQIRLLHHTRPNASHEPTPTVVFLAYHYSECMRKQVIICVNPYGTNIVPQYFRIGEWRQCWSRDDNPKAFDGRTNWAEYALELVGGRGIIFGMPHNHNVRIFLTRRVHVRGNMLYNDTPSPNKSIFALCSMPSWKYRSRNSWSVQ